MYEAWHCRDGMWGARPAGIGRTREEARVVAWTLARGKVLGLGTDYPRDGRTPLGGQWVWISPGEGYVILEQGNVPMPTGQQIEEAIRALEEVDG